MLRYLRLFSSLARFGLARELAFRTNFLAKLAVELIWLGLLLAFYRTVFAKTSYVAGWGENEFLFFIGCYFALEGLVETLFLENCSDFAELIRTGDLDFVLLKPIDEQFLVSCRSLDWSTAPNVLLGGSVMLLALHNLGWSLTPDTALRGTLFVILFACSLGLAYSFLLALTSTSVWFVRNQSLLELWWLFTSLMRYPKEIFNKGWAAPVGTFFTFVVPIMLVINVPARLMVKPLEEPWLAVFTVLATIVMLIISRWFFRLSLTRYKSASS